MGTRHWLSVVGMFVCGVNELTRLEAPWIPVIITSLLSPLALIAAFCFVLCSIRFHAANHSGLPALFSVCTAGDVSTFLYKPCMACFLFFAFCHLFFSQNMFLIYVSMVFCCFCALIN